MSVVHLTVEGAVAEIRLDTPAKMNALTVPMLRQIAEHCDGIERRPEVRAVLLTSEGERAFCTGADIKAWGDIPPGDFARHGVREGHRVFDRLARLAKPTIAVLQGPAFGGGLELAATCDIRILAPGAMIALPEAGVGIVPGWSGTQRLLRLLPEPVVKEMALFGRRLAAERALALGFAAEIAADPRARAFGIARDLAALSPRSVEVAKWMIHAAAGEDRGSMIEALAQGDRATYDAHLEPTVPLSREIFRAPTRFYKAGIAFLAWLNGTQAHFVMPAGFQSSRDITHYAGVFRLADRARLLARPDLAEARMRTLLALHGVE